MARRRSFLGTLGLVSLGILLGLLLLECLLELRARFVTPFPAPQVTSVPQVVPDDRLGYRPNPHFPGHDSNGWRNSSLPERADIVVIGDSHVYGSAWPQRVGARLHHTVYQMGANGYGPAQYALLIDQALAVQPKIIIATYDYSDDIYDSYQFVYRIGGFKRSILDTAFDSTFTLTSLQSQEALSRAEREAPTNLQVIGVRLGYQDLPALTCRGKIDAEPLPHISVQYQCNLRRNFTNADPSRKRPNRYPHSTRHASQAPLLGASPGTLIRRLQNDFSLLLESQ